MSEDKKANKGTKELSGRVFNIMQYEKHPETGEILLTERMIEYACKNYKSLTEWAWVAHDKDVFSAEDEKENPAHKKGIVKPKHFHIVVKCKNAYKVSQLAKWFGIPNNFIRVPKGGNRAFADCLEYLTHESERQQELGKHLYGDEEVHSNIDFRGVLEIGKMNKSEKMAKGIFEDEREKCRYQVLYEGKSLSQMVDENRSVYMEDFDKLKKLRMDYITNRAPMPAIRVNYYVTGKGGTGKGVLSRALARNLFPGLNDDDCFFNVGAKGAPFEGYDGQPVLIWNDRRSIDLLTELNGRGNVFNVFDTFPVRMKQNVKYASINLTNCVNIVNSVEDYEEFLDGLAGEYTDKNGKKFESEDKNQSYRRFPFIIPIDETQIKFMINKGYLEEGTYQEYECFNNLKINIKNLTERIGVNREIENKVMNKITEKQVDKHREIEDKIKSKANMTYEEEQAILEEVEKAIQESEASVSEAVAENESCADQVQLGDGFKLVKGEVLPFTVDGENVKKRSGRRKKETV